MLKPLVTGLFLAVGAAVVLLVGSGSDLEHQALLGAALGGALGLAHPERVLGRMTGFLIGFAASWAGFALRAAALPDSTSGRAVAALVVVVVCTLAAALSRDRIPLWSALLGCAALVAAYETSYDAAPALFLTDSPRAATTILVAAAVGVLVTSLAHAVLPHGTEEPDGSWWQSLRARMHSSDQDAEDSMADLMAGDTEAGPTGSSTPEHTSIPDRTPTAGAAPRHAAPDGARDTPSTGTTITGDRG